MLSLPACKPLLSTAKTPKPISMLIENRVVNSFMTLFVSFIGTWAGGSSLAKFPPVSKVSQRLLAGTRVSIEIYNPIKVN